MKYKKLILLFGILEHLILGLIIFLVFQALSKIYGEPVIGMDTQLLLSIGFPLFAFLKKHVAYNS